MGPPGPHASRQPGYGRFELESVSDTHRADARTSTASTLDTWMYEVQPNLLWLGHSFDLREPQLLFDVGIAAVIDLAIEQPPAQLPRTLIYCRFPIHDGGGNDAHVLVQSVQTLVDLLAGGTPTLAVCGAGMSRAPTIVAHALALHLGQKPEEVLLRIREDRSLEIKATLWDDVSSLLPRIRSGTLQT